MASSQAGRSGFPSVEKTFFPFDFHEFEDVLPSKSSFKNESICFCLMNSDQDQIYRGVMYD